MVAPSKSEGHEPHVQTSDGPHQSERVSSVRITAEECVDISGETLREVFARRHNLSRRHARGASAVFRGVSTTLRGLEMVDG